MTRVSFYTLADDVQGDRFQVTCRLVERIHGEGLRLYVRAASEQEARHLDRLLWTFRQQSFIPHGLRGETDSDLTPVLIGWNGDAPDTRPILINLAPALPPGFERYERVCEAVDHDPAIRAAARERFRSYRRSGLQLDHYQIRL